MHANLPSAINIAKPVNWAHPLNRGLVSWWLALPGGWGRGPTWFDLCKKNNGTLTNGPVWNSPFGRPGGSGALNLDGSNDYVDCGSASSLSLTITDAFTVSCWLRNAQTADANIVAKQRNAGSFQGYGIVLTNSRSAIEALIYGGSTHPGLLVSWPSNYADSTWHHLAFSYDGSMNVSGLNLYTDGALVTGTTVLNDATAATDITNSVSLQISGRGGSAANVWGGYIDDVRIQKKALSGSELRAEYDLSRQGYGPLLNRVQRRIVKAHAVTATTNNTRRALLGVGI